MSTRTHLGTWFPATSPLPEAAQPYLPAAREHTADLQAAALDGLAIVRFAGAALTCLLIGATVLADTGPPRR